jgi:hypothetical protein
VPRPNPNGPAMSKGITQRTHSLGQKRPERRLFFEKLNHKAIAFRDRVVREKFPYTAAGAPLACGIAFAGYVFGDPIVGLAPKPTTVLSGIFF